ncbi:CidA/LrgA family protein [Crassaminicella profunda]|uniref:CidA/LrgA family protein n=1 Tax=Crassaminicella profunda TaxID=1286698 RepID=UPI001CA6D4B4|nr:CidA/LrgA family protein [Crassaminicella profunda]QZY55617.1 CidA/LrgA family protein [Crassaminicella profunda]
MKKFIQLLLIICIWQLGEYLHQISNIPIPGSILGMFILFGLLSLKVIKLDWVEECGEFFLKHLAFFFIPSGVALIASLDLLKANWLPLSIIILLSTIIVMGVTGLIVQKFVKD